MEAGGGERRRGEVEGRGGGERRRGEAEGRERCLGLPSSSGNDIWTVEPLLNVFEYVCTKTAE